MEATESKLAASAETTTVNTPETVDNSDNEIKKPEELESPEKPQETGQRETVNVPPVLEISEEDLVSESPLDLTIQVTRKRKLVEVDLRDDQIVDGILEPVCKKMRPSVISFARRKSRRIEILTTNADPAEHFLRALGPQLYNMIYGTYYGSFVGRLHDGRYSSLVEMERQCINRGRLTVDEHFRRSLGKNTWVEMQGFP